MGILALGKDCRYCSLCELIICHRDELEDELVHSNDIYTFMVISEVGHKSQPIP
jgi:hypothetical protein